MINPTQFNEQLREIRDINNNKVDQYEREWNEWLDKNLEKLKETVGNALEDVENWDVYKDDDYYYENGENNSNDKVNYEFNYELNINITTHINPFFKPFEFVKLLGSGINCTYGEYRNNSNLYIAYLRKMDSNPSCKQEIDEKIKARTEESNAIKMMEENEKVMNKENEEKIKYETIVKEMDMNINKVIELVTNPNSYHAPSRSEKNGKYYTISYYCLIPKSYPELVKQYKDGIKNKLSEYKNIIINYNDYSNAISTHGVVDSLML